MSQTLSVSNPEKQSPPHHLIQETGHRRKITRCVARALSEWLSEAQSHKICRRYLTAMRVLWWLSVMVIDVVQTSA